MTLPLTDKRQRDREQYQKNKDRRRSKRLEQSRAWASTNRERKRELYKNWVESNQERRRAHNAKWRDNEERRQAARESAAKWRAENRERHLASQKKWHKDNGAKWKAEWLKKNPDHYKIQQQNRRSRKRAAAGSISKDDVDRILRSQRWKCAYCRIGLRHSGYHLDHIIPLVGGGSNHPSNHQATCPECNMSKGSTDPIKFAQSRGMLI